MIESWLCGKEKSHLWVSKATGSPTASHIPSDGTLGGRNHETTVFQVVFLSTQIPQKQFSRKGLKKSLRKESKVIPPGKITRHRCLPRPWEVKKLAVARISQMYFLGTALTIYEISLLL